MHPRDELVRFDAFEAEIRKLELWLDELGIQPDQGSDVVQQASQAFRALYYSVFAVERPSMSRGQEINEGAALAGLGDLAAKINRARASPHFSTLLPHLKNMVRGAVRMNMKSSVTDDAANKHSELYVGCLALGAGMSVELEDPVASGGGKNPDLLLHGRGRDWSIAVKTAHGSSAPSIFANIKGAVKQIERSERDGLAFVNLKNLVDHEALATASPFPNPGDATFAVSQQIDAITARLRAEIADDDWIELFTGKRARPIVAFMAQITASAYVIPGVPMFVPVKVMRALPFPPAPESADLLVEDDAATLLEALNEELQRNPPS